MQNTMVDEIINTDKENLLEDTTFIVDIDDKNTRIDKYLSDELADVSRSRIQKLLDEGHFMEDFLIEKTKPEQAE